MLDGYAIFLFVCLVDGWMDGWICVNIGGRECGGRAQLLPRNANQVSTAFGENRVAWFGLLGLLVACLFDGWMDGWSVD